MTKHLIVLTGIALISMATLVGCGQQSHNGSGTTHISMPPTQVKKLANATTPSQNSTDKNATPSSNNVVPGGVGVGTPVPAALSKQNTGPLSAVSFATDKIGFIASANGIYRTLDGGQTWEKVYDATEPIVGLQATQAILRGQQHIYAVAWTKNGMFDTLTGDAFSRVHFDGNTTAGIRTAPIGDVQILLNDVTGGDFLAFVSRGAIWSSNPNQNGKGWIKATPPVPVASVATVKASTWYAATTSGAIYKTTDFGQHWMKVFTAPIKPGLGWQPQIKAMENHVSVLYTSPDLATQLQPYVLYESNDGGKTWNSLFDEPYLTQDYGTTKPLYPQALSLQAGPFALLTNGNISMIGIHEIGNVIPTLSMLTPQGKRIMFDPIGPSANSPDVFGQGEMPTAISAPDTTHFFVMGGNANSAVMQVTTNGGATWTAR